MKAKQGVILITALFFVILFFMLSFALYQLSPGEHRTALRDKSMAEAHFGCTAAIRVAKEWITAVAKADPSNGTTINSLGYNWAGGSFLVGSSTVVTQAANDVFSVPNTDTNFNRTNLGALTCPNGRFVGKSGVDFLGLAPDANLSNQDYLDLKANQNSWLALKTPNNNPLTLGDIKMYTYIVPSADTMQQLTGTKSLGLRSYLVTTIAYRSNLPVLRARCLLKEQSAADFAYRANKGGVDSVGNPVTWNIQNANTVLFDGPVHTNDAPWISAPASYWNASLTYLPNEPLRPKRAFLGSLTFSGTNTSVDPNLSFDGVGYLGGNYAGTNINNRPFDNAGNPIASTAQGANPDPPGGKIVNRYDRMIEGGRQSIRKVAAAPLPADLVILKEAAFGKDSETGLNTSNVNPALWQVNPTQKSGSIQAGSITRPGYTNSSGNWVGPQTYTNTGTEEVGIFVNAKSGTTKAAGGIVVKGSTRNMYLEVQDSTGNLVTDVSGLEAGSSQGNPVTRIQSTLDSYDTNSGTNITTYAPGPPVETWNPPAPGTWHAPVAGFTTPAQPGYTTGAAAGYTTPAQPGYTTGFVAAYTTPAQPGYTSSNPNLVHSPPIASDTYHPPTGGGTAQGYYTCPGHPQPGTWHPPVAAVFHPQVNGTYTAPVAAVYHPPVAGVWHPPVAAFYTPPVAGYTSGATAGFTSTGPGPAVPVGQVVAPFKYKAQDWVVDVKTVGTTIPATIGTPTFSAPGVELPTPQTNAWRTGVGGVLPVDRTPRTLSSTQGGDNEDNYYGSGNTNGASYTKQAPLLARTPDKDPLVPGIQGQGITEVWVHGEDGSVALSTGVPVPVGKIVVYKQSRSDANRVDAFIMSRPDKPVTEQPGSVNGAVFSTGDIQNLRGVNMGAKSIGVDYTGGKGISIADSVWQFGTQRGKKPTTPYNGLGMAATKMNVQTRADTFASANAKLYLYATMIAGSSQSGNTGGMDVSQSPNNNSHTTNFNQTAVSTNNQATNRTVEIFGGLTEQVTKARLVGTAGGDRGWNQQMNFDKQLSYQPPPFFPTTNTLVPLAYTQESVIGR